MTTQKALSITKDYSIQISIGVLLLLAGGVWNLSRAAFLIESRLQRIEANQWTVNMERETWRHAEKLNAGFTSPNVSVIISDLRN